MAKKNKISQSSYAGFVLTFEPERTEWLAERLMPDAVFTESFSAIDSVFDRKELVLLVLHKDPLAISAVALMERMHGSGGSGKLKMKLMDTLVFERPIADDEIVGASVRSSMCTPETLRRVLPGEWTTLVSEIQRLRLNDAAAFVELLAERTTVHRLLGQSSRIDTLNEQRDGIGLGLDIAQIERSPFLKRMNVETVHQAASVLDLLDSIPISERSLLEHDQRIFELLLGRQSTRSASFTDGSARSVRIHVVDQTDLETVLGIDLIIYNVCHNSFLLLQYKRMENHDAGWRYPIYPSSNLHTQLERMTAFRVASAAIQPPTPTLWSYRLNSDPFYFKFCERQKPQARDESLLRGITISDLHLREFLNLPEAIGENGRGCTIGYHNCPRYFNNTQFVELARSAWIGAGPQSSQLLQQVLQANAIGGRSAMLAVIDTPRATSALGRRRK